MSEVQFGQHPWMHKIPFKLKVMDFSPRWRAVIQLSITVLLVGSMYAAYRNSEAIVEGIGFTGMRLTPDASPPSWAFLVLPLMSIIPAVYVFLYLKYNFLQ